jgi:hypothetical protein
MHGNHLIEKGPTEAQWAKANRKNKESHLPRDVSNAHENPAITVSTLSSPA